MKKGSPTMKKILGVAFAFMLTLIAVQPAEASVQSDFQAIVQKLAALKLPPNSPQSAEAVRLLQSTHRLLVSLTQLKASVPSGVGACPDRPARPHQNFGRKPSFECIPYAYGLANQGLSADTSTALATKVCLGVRNLEVFKFAYQQAAKWNSKEKALKLAGQIAREVPRGAESCFQFMFNKANALSSWEKALKKAAESCRGG